MTLFSDFVRYSTFAHEPPAESEFPFLVQNSQAYSVSRRRVNGSCSDPVVAGNLPELQAVCRDK
jgi:hypothetical protein